MLKMRPSARLRVATSSISVIFWSTTLRRTTSSTGAPTFFHNGGRGSHAAALIEKVLPIAAQASHRSHQADLVERLLDGVFGDAHFVAEWQLARVVLHERVESRGERAAQAFAVAARGGSGCRFGCGRGLRNGRAGEQDQAQRNELLHEVILTANNDRSSRTCRAVMPDSRASPVNRRALSQRT